MRQTYAGPMECLIVDDCGTDESIPIAEYMIAEYEGPIRFEILHHDHNRGLSAARNTGMEKAVGDYIYFIDSDDEITEDCLEKMMAVAEAHPEVELVQGSFVRTRNGKDTIGPNEIRIMHACSNDEVRICFYQYKQVFVAAWNKLMKRSLVRNNHLIFTEGLLYEDGPWTYFLLKCVKDAWFLSDITYLYKIRPNSIVTGTSRADATIHRLMGYHDMIQHISPDHVQQETEYYIMVFATYTLHRADGFPGLKDDYRYYRQYALENRRIKWLIILDVFWFLGSFKYGWVLYSLLIRLKHPTQIPKDIVRSLRWVGRKVKPLVYAR